MWGVVLFFKGKPTALTLILRHTIHIGDITVAINANAYVAEALSFLARMLKGRRSLLKDAESF